MLRGVGDSGGEGGIRTLDRGLSAYNALPIIAPKKFWWSGKARLAPWAKVPPVALRKLWMVDNAAQLLDLRVPPGNRLEALRGDRKGQHSIRINERFRVCFRWKDGDAYAVEIVDYH